MNILVLYKHMVRRNLARGVFVVLFLYCVPTHGQVVKKYPPGPLYLAAVREHQSPFAGDEKNPKNMDYFVADHDPSTKHYLFLVDNAHTNKVLSSIRADRLENAMDDLNYTLNKFVNHPKALMLLGMVARLSRKPSLPLPYYEKAIGLYPQYAFTYAQYGNYLVEMGNLAGGVQRLKQAVELDPTLVAAYVWLARAYSRNGDAELAQGAADKARALGYRGQIPDRIDQLEEGGK
jgi:tetratricopeptide (TPR) repeat protein